MAQTYGDDSKRVYARKDLTTVKIGGDTYALANYVEYWAEYALEQREQLGADKPLQASGLFSGFIRIRRVYSTDKDLLTLITPSNGITPESTIEFAYKDTQGTPVTKTWTIKARLNRIEHRWDLAGERFVMATVSGYMTEAPTIA